MDRTQFDLLKTKRFLPLFVTQALGALNDNVFKNAMAILMVYKLAEAGGYDKAVLATAAGGVFILPFFLFSATAGQLADKYDKAMLIRNIKLAEILIMALGVAALFAGQIVPLFVVLFLMGMQSTFFGPLKYSILPVHLNEGELIGANSLIEAGTFLAILAGTIAGGLLILATWGVEVVSVLVLALAAAGYAASLGIPSAPAPSPSLIVNWNVAGESWRMVSKAFSQRFSALTILGISWFWLVGATFLSLFPAIVNDLLKGDETVVTLFLVLFTVGVAIGSMLCNRLLKGEVTAIYAPFGALGITVFVADFAWNLMTHQPPAAATAGGGDALIGGFTFMGEVSNWRMMVDLVGVAMCGGIFIVPLYAILQARSDEADRSRTIAANNIVNAFFMTAGAGIVAGLIGAGLGIPVILLVIAGLNLIVALYVTKLLPDAIIKTFLVAVLKLLFRVEVKGLEHYSKAGDRAVIVVNHVSFLDPVLLAAFLPVKPLFAVNTHIAQAWWVAPFLRLVDAFPMDPTNPMAAKALVREVQKDKHCVIFPEGRITVTGALMKVFDGPAMIADQADAMLVPVRIDGAQYSLFSRLKGKVRRRWFPKITLTVLPPRKLAVPEDAVGKTRRRLAGQELYDVMSDMVFETCDRRRSLFDALLDARAAHGGSHAVIEDIERSPLSYDKLVLGARILGRKLAAQNAAGRARRRHGAQLDGRGGDLLRAAVARPRACHAELFNRRIEHAGGHQGGGNQDGADLAPVRRDGQAARRHRGVQRSCRCGLPGRRQGVGLDAGQAARTAEPAVCRCAAQPCRHQPGRACGGAVHVRFRRHAEGRGAEPCQPAGQLLSAVVAGGLQPAGHRVQCAAGVPLVWLDRWHLVAGFERRESLHVSFAATLSHRAGTGLRHQCHDHVRHRYVPGGLCALVGSV
jgi:acyl-[acyl-carrier-protein]-phospholipid O-acyltransferase/long-chain-fatty-acid--[acyl-carrier-protein] ligase